MLFAIAHRDSLFSISHSLAFVKCFFQVFSNSFFSTVSRDSLYIISYQLRFVNTFFQLFSSLFSSILLSLIADSSVILPYLSPFVKHFCITFLSFFDYFNQILTYPHVSTAFPQPYPQFDVVLVSEYLVFYTSSTVNGPPSPQGEG